MSKSGKNPMMSEEVEKLLNYRIEQEEQSSRIYLAMSMWLTNTGYLGAGKLWRKYANEEMSHAEWARDYILAMGCQPSVPALKSPQQSFVDLPQIVKMSYDHEIEVTKQIKEFAKKALTTGDTMVFTLTQKYLAEQVEEHDKLQNFVDRISAFGVSPILMRELDDEMGDLA